MKRLLHYSLVFIMVLLISCHARKKTVEQHRQENTTLVVHADSVANKQVSQKQSTDSSKVERKDSSLAFKKEKIDIEFRFGNKIVTPPVADGMGNNDFINNLISTALSNSETLKMHIEREQEDRRVSAYSKIKGSNTKQTVVKDSVHYINDKVKTTVKHIDTITKTESKPAYSWIAWLIGSVAVAVFIWVKIYRRK